MANLAAPIGSVAGLTTHLALIGGVPATVLFSEMSPGFVGVSQLNVTIPNGLGDGSVIPLQIQIGGITTNAQVTLASQ